MSCMVHAYLSEGCVSAFPLSRRVSAWLPHEKTRDENNYLLRRLFVSVLWLLVFPALEIRKATAFLGDRQRAINSFRFTLFPG